MGNREPGGGGDSSGPSLRLVNPLRIQRILTEQQPFEPSTRSNDRSGDRSYAGGRGAGRGGGAGGRGGGGRGGGAAPLNNKVATIDSTGESVTRGPAYDDYGGRGGGRYNIQ
jgi:hypothetical protein